MGSLSTWSAMYQGSGPSMSQGLLGADSQSRSITSTEYSPGLCGGSSPPQFPTAPAYGVDATGELTETNAILDYRYKAYEESVAWMRWLILGGFLVGFVASAVVGMSGGSPIIGFAICGLSMVVLIGGGIAGSTIGSS